MDFAAMMKAERARDAAERLAELERSRAAEAFPGPAPELPTLVDLGRGVRYCNAFLSAEEAAALVVAIDAHPSGAWCTLTKRKLLNLGGVPHPSGSWSEPLPETITSLVAARLVAMGVFEELPDQVLLNEYQDGAGIDRHRDGPCFRPCAAVVSLESDALLEFSEPPPSTAVVATVVLRRNSLVVFGGAEAYGHLYHGISDGPPGSGSSAACAVPATVLNAQAAQCAVGDSLPRQSPRRLSLTLRQLARVEKRIGPFDVLGPDVEAERLRRQGWWLQSISE